MPFRVRKARLKAGLSQEQAAHQVERSDRWLLKVENGQTDPGYGDLVRLAPVLHVELEQIVLDKRTETTIRGASAPQSAPPTITDPAMMAAEVLRRRGFLQAGLVVTGGILLGPWSGFEHGTESRELAALRQALLHYGPEYVSEDVAVAYGLIEKPGSALNALLTAEQVAFEEVRLDPGARALVADLQQHAQRHGPQLNALPDRMAKTGWNAGSCR